jgi:Tfp pilus assembly protein PilV
MVDAAIRQRPSRGFTVAEILLALALISVVVLTLIGLRARQRIINAFSQGPNSTREPPHRKNQWLNQAVSAFF